jgi:hypothetical protein
MTTVERQEEFAPRVEGDRVPPKALWWTGAVTVTVIAASVVISSRLLQSWTRPMPERGSGPARAQAEMGLVEQTLILTTRRGLDQQTKQRESLQTFGWVDRPHGIAKIPIDRAMDLVADPAFMRRSVGPELLPGGPADRGDPPDGGEK